MWKYKVQLNAGDTLRFEARQKTAQGQDVERYSIVNAVGDVVGSVHLTESPGTLPAQRHLRLVQRDAWDDTVVDLRWTA